MTQNPPQPRLPSSFIAPANLQLGSLAQFEGQWVSHLRLEPRFFGFTSFGGRLVDADATPNLVCLGALVPGSKASFQGGIASRTPGKRLVRNLTKIVIRSSKSIQKKLWFVQLTQPNLPSTNHVCSTQKAAYRLLAFHLSKILWGKGGSLCFCHVKKSNSNMQKLKLKRLVIPGVWRLLIWPSRINITEGDLLRHRSHSCVSGLKNH